MASLADISMHGRSSIDLAASAIAAILGLSSIMMFYHGYSGFPEIAMPAGAGLLLASLVIGAQGYRRKRTDKKYEDDAGTVMRAIADTLPDAVIVRDLDGEVVFANAAARRASVDGAWASVVANTRGGDNHRLLHGSDVNAVQMQPAGTDASAAGIQMPWRDMAGRLLGWIEIGTKPQRAVPAMAEFHRTDLKAADLEALVAERTTQVRELMAHLEASREEERRAIAQKLHGELGGSLTALSMHLAMLSQSLPGDVVVRERIKQMKELLNSAAATTRNIQSALLPDKLELFGLQAAVEELAAQMSDDTGIACELHFPEMTGSSSAVSEMALYRMLEEALRNITRHAYATEVCISLEEAEDSLSLCVRDNGVGFSPADLPHGAHGLCRMRERVVYLGGSLMVHSAPGQGTTVEITLPKQARQAQAN